MHHGSGPIAALTPGTDEPVTDDRGFSLLVTVISLLVTALLVLLLLKATGTSGSGKSGTPSPPVAAADATQAQQSLSAGLSTLQQVDAGGQGSVDATALQAADPSLTFAPGASTGPSTVSVTPQSDGSSVTLADRSTDGTCWVVWWSPTSSPWYGAQTGQGSCTAPSVSGTPTPGPVSGSSVGWQQESFPAA